MGCGPSSGNLLEPHRHFRTHITVYREAETAVSSLTRKQDKYHACSAAVGHSQPSSAGQDQENSSARKGFTTYHLSRIADVDELRSGEAVSCAEPQIADTAPSGIKADIPWQTTNQRAWKRQNRHVA